MAVTIGLSANAGICITTPGLRCWIDLLHEEKTETFSVVTAEMWEQIKTHPDFKNPDVICVSHFHPDHCSEHLLGEAEALYPHAVVITPDRMAAGHTFRAGENTILFLKTVHEGRAFQDTVHYSILFIGGGHRIFITADAKIEEKVLEAVEPYLPVDTVVAAFPWLTTGRGRRILAELVDPETVIAYHLPFAEDDVFGYRKAAENLAEKINAGGEGCPDPVGRRVMLLSEPLQTIRLP